MPGKTPVERFRKDYKAPDYVVHEVRLVIKIFEESAQILSTLHVKRAASAPADAALILDAEELDLASVSVDGDVLPADGFVFDKDQDLLSIMGPLPAEFKLECDVCIKPHLNTQLSGLYKSSGVYCTQCEAEGFRRITPMQDRPDVMASYTSVRIEACKSKCPVLLSNGNLVSKGDLEDNRHFTEWQDPFKKPSYLFAVVAGDLGSISDTFKTMSGRDVSLHVYSEKHNVDKLAHAMGSLKKAMRWDEDTFGREYDLDIFNIVAVDDFNMGAMENKSLNIFNTSCVCASPATATDADFERVQGIVAHEYFHNWTGNRVTCRDWFQLTLKEGLTVFRDQQFSSDMTSAAVKRIEDVQVVRALQFPEDRGPMRHPIRPESYIAMDNFYTATVYRKGAEVIRMYHTLLGAEGFRKGMDLYFERHDGQAVTCDDFRAAMADANGYDLSQFERWYTQCGTPTVSCSKSYSAADKSISITLEQTCPDAPGGEPAQPFLMPVRVGFLAKQADGKARQVHEEEVLRFQEAKQTFVIKDVMEEPVLSIGRNFSAPVKFEYTRDDDELAFLMGNDTDSFNRWEAGQQLFSRAIHANVKLYQTQGEGAMTVAPGLVAAFKSTLTDTSLDKSLCAYALQTPTLATLAEDMEMVDPDALVAARIFTRRHIVKLLRADLLKVYHENSLPAEPFRNDKKAIGCRRLKNTCLGYLSELEDEETIAIMEKQAMETSCMTDLASAATCLSGISCAAREKVMAHFYEKHARGNDLILCKWFTIGASASTDDALDRVNKLLGHADFSLKNPNKCRSVVLSFAVNMKPFHKPDGSGYKWLTDRILAIDKINPQVAAKLTSKLSSFRRFDKSRQALMQEQLQRIKEAEGVSKDTFEIAMRSLS